MKFHYVLAISLFLSTTVDAQRGLTVNTQQGDVLGTFATPTVRQFLGIPFAIAKRWEAPKTPPHQVGIFHATNFSDSCIQSPTPSIAEFLILTNNQAAGLNVTESEDCLTVNIWSPSIERKQNTAVMIWIYGGGYEFGTSNLDIYNGTHFVRDNDDITIITFNYRMNIFGQPNAPQLASKTKSQNFGLLDVDAVVQWVHDNIRNFGGDPERIVLFGQSAGGGAADAYTFAHPHDTMVKGIIQQSGSVPIAIFRVTAPDAVLDPTPWNTVATVVGCGNATTLAQFSCMQAVPFRTLENAVLSSNAQFNYVVDNINLFSDYFQRSAAGNFSRVPVLAGSTENEFDVFVAAQEVITSGVVVPVLTEVLADIDTQMFITCEVGNTTLDRINAGVPTWRYQYQAVFPDISTFPHLRSYHSSEIPLVFGTYNASGPGIAPTPTEIALSKYIQRAWVAFARDPTHGLLDFGWPMYNPNTTSLAQLGNVQNATGVVFAQGGMLDFSCSQVGVLGEIAAQLGGLLPGGGGVLG